MRNVTRTCGLVPRRHIALLTLLLGALALSTPSAAAAPATATIIAQGDKRVAVLENEWIRATVSPARGGRVSSFIVKRNNWEMVTDAANGGLFMDHFYEQNWPGEFLDAPYEVEVVEAGPGQASVRVSCLSTGQWGDR